MSTAYVSSTASRLGREAPSGAFVDGGERVVPFGRDPLNGSDDYDVDLHSVT